MLNTLAWDSHGHKVNATDAEKGGRYTCPTCKERLISRRSWVQKKGFRRPHFTHQAGHLPCSAESILHNVFQKLIHDRLAQALANGDEVPVRWQCSYCNTEHRRNLISKAQKVVLEHNMVTARADVGLLDVHGKTLVAIEVVFTHEPEPAVNLFYRKNNIALIRFDITDENDLKRTEDPILAPDYVDQCITKRCPDCHGFQKSKTLRIEEVACTSSGSVSKLAWIKAGIDRLAHPATPEKFTPEELQFAMNEGASIRPVRNSFLNQTLPTHVCSGCNEPFQGPFHPSAYRSVTSAPVAVVKEIPIGYYCEPCSFTAGRKGIHSYLRLLNKDRAALPRPEGPWHCIDCNVSIPREDSHTFCRKCHDDRRRRNQFDHEGKHCLECGKSTVISRDVPFCDGCRKAWGKLKGQEAEIDAEINRVKVLLR